jgi:rifampicin phosphotransferase
VTGTAAPDVSSAGFEPCWDDPADAAYCWRKGWGGAMPRLHHDLVRSYYEGQRRCWEDCGSPMAKDHIVMFVNGFVYNRGPEMDEAAVRRLGALVERNNASYARRKGESWYEAEIRPPVVEIIERVRRHPRPTRPLPELVAHLEECIEAHSEVMGFYHWKMAAAAIRGSDAAPGYHWPATYEEITGRPGAEASLLVGGVKNQMSMTVAALRKLARLAQSDPELLRAVGSGDAGALERDEPVFNRFRSRFRALLRRYGHRTGNGWGSNVNDFVAPTWNVSPALPLQMIATYARSDLDAIDAKERAAASKRKRIAREVRKALAGDPERLARFEEALTEATFVSWLMEDHNDWMDQASVGVVRDATHVVGERLVRDGVIDDPDDVMHLSLDELHALPFEGVRQLVAERRAEFERQRSIDAPDHIGAEPSGPSMPNMNDEGEGHVGNELRGVAASPGRFTGIARVRLPSPTLPDIEDGEILVATDAGPDWTPLFAVLGAVVLDVGAIWQHAAVMAREFGIPAVTGTKTATTAIRDGQTITVDGDTGIVELA